MAIVSGKQPTMHAQAPTTSATTGGQGVPNPVAQAVQKAGLVQPGQTPQDAAKAILGQLNGGGFQAPAAAGKDFTSQLAGALKLFQAAAGLPQTGKLDGATAAALKGLGQETPQAGEKALRDNFEKGGGPSLLKSGERSRADLAKNSTPDTNFLDALINKLGGDHGVTADRAGQVGGTKETPTQAQTDAAKDVKKAAEADNSKGATADAKKTSADNAQQQLDRAHRDPKLQVARGLKAESTRTEEQRRKNSLQGKDATELGILDEEADEDAVEGDGGEGSRKGKGGDQSGGGHDAEGADLAGGTAGKDGEEKGQGNASSGLDEDGNPIRGHASIDDGSDDEAGHYQVGSLSEQAFTALAEIKMDQSASNKATTYSWDVMFFKPGIYGPGQKADDLVHLVVQEATAFDPVWQRAQANLQAMIRRVDREGDVPTLDDIVGALRQARARDGDTSAVELKPFKLPMGRA